MSELVDDLRDHASYDQSRYRSDCMYSAAYEIERMTAELKEAKKIVVESNLAARWLFQYIPYGWSYTEALKRWPWLEEKRDV